MADKKEETKVHLRVLTPQQVVYDEPVDMVVLRTVDGDIGIMQGHEPCSALLHDWPLRIVTNESEHEDLLMILGGILTVRDDVAVVSSDMAVHPDKLQGYIDDMQDERRHNMLKERQEDLYTQRMETAIRNALVQLDVSAYSLIKSAEQSE